MSMQDLVVTNVFKKISDKNIFGNHCHVVNRRKAKKLFGRLTNTRNQALPKFFRSLVFSSNLIKVAYMYSSDPIARATIACQMSVKVTSAKNDPPWYEETKQLQYLKGVETLGCTYHLLTYPHRAHEDSWDRPEDCGIHPGLPPIRLQPPWMPSQMVSFFLHGSSPRFSRPASPPLAFMCPR